MQSSKESMAYLWLSLCLLSMTPIAIKWIKLSAASILVFRCLVGGLALVAFIFIARQSFLPDTRRGYLELALPGILLGLHWFTYFQAIQLSTVAIAVLSMYTFPIFTALLEPFFGGRRPGLLDALTIVWVMVGLYLIVPEIDGWNTHVMGALIGLVSAILFALRNLISQRLLSRHTGSKVMLHQLFWAGLGFIPLAHDFADFSLTSNLLTGLFLAIVLTALAHSLWVQSHANLPALRVGLLSSIAPVLSMVWAILIFQEWPDFFGILGATMILGAAVLEVYKQNKSKSAS